MGLLEGDVGAGDIGVVECSTVYVRLVIGNLLVVLECLGAVTKSVKEPSRLSGSGTTYAVVSWADAIASRLSCNQRPGQWKTVREQRV